MSTKMRVPKTIKVGCFDFQVVWEEKIEHGDDECWGLCDDNERKFVFASRLKKDPQRLKEIVLHECLHSIEHVYNVSLGEKKVDILAKALLALLEENQWIMKIK